MDPERAVEAARALVRLWQSEAKAALISLEVWPELGEAIDELGESFAPARAYPGAALHPRDLLSGDEIRYPPGPFEDGVGVWTVVESVPDVPRRGDGWWRLVAGRLDGDGWVKRAGDHPPGETVTLVRRP